MKAILFFTFAALILIIMLAVDRGSRRLDTITALTLQVDSLKAETNRQRLHLAPDSLTVLFLEHYGNGTIVWQSGIISQRDLNAISFNEGRRAALGLPHPGAKGAIWLPHWDSTDTTTTGWNQMNVKRETITINADVEVDIKYVKDSNGVQVEYEPSKEELEEIARLPMEITWRTLPEDSITIYMGVPCAKEDANGSGIHYHADGSPPDTVWWHNSEIKIANKDLK